MTCLDTVIFNAYVYSPEPLNVEAVGLDKGKIVFLGTLHDAELSKCKKTKFIDAEGLSLLPGIIDSHTHMIDEGFRSTWLDLSNINSFKDLIKALAEAKKIVKKGEWILGHSWDESKWKDEPRYPTKKDLDEVSKGHPIFIRRIDGHMGVINSKAYEVLKMPKGTPGIIKDSQGEFTGIVKEAALEYIDNKLKNNMHALIKAVEVAFKKALKKGVTTVHDFLYPQTFNALQHYFYSRWNMYRVSVYFWSKYADRLIDLGFRPELGNSFIKIAGIKLMMDGSIGARTAALRDPYIDDPSNRGMILVDIEELKELLKKGERMGFQFAIHAIGDRAIDAVLEVYKESQQMKKLRHRIEHFELVHEEHLKFVRKHDIALSMQPNFVANWQQPNGLYEKRLGKERVKQMNPFRAIVDMGIHMAFGSDCMPFDPFYGIFGAVEHPIKNSAITILEAIKAYTFEGAYIERNEDIKGRIERNYLADLVLVKGDIASIKSRDIPKLQVISTIINGRIHKIH
ncbi:MAG: amidohydrolase [Candidatus Njordarchaeia archaeon]